MRNGFFKQGHMFRLHKLCVCNSLLFVLLVLFMPTILRSKTISAHLIGRAVLERSQILVLRDC